MNINDILILCKAGFTAEQIGKMSAVQPETTPVQPETPPVQPAPEVTPAEPVTQEKEVTTVPAPASVNAELVSAIADLKQTIVNSNIINSNQPAPKVDTVESIINTMIGGNQ